ncbi:hypothetical protein BFRIG_01868 [Peribacillus frigoritolerans]|uniref:HNH endonuclease n=1 Tax=Peribacillus frigoritolerans TaxID=450367 RepID=UPI0030D04C75
MNVYDEIISMRKNGMMQKEIACGLSITRDKVRYVLKKANLENFLFKKTCAQCDTDFETTGSHAKFCSKRCRGKYNKANNGYQQVCKNCKNTFVKYKEQGFCNKKCQLEYFSSHKKLKEYVPVPKKKYNCIVCRNEYKTTSSVARFCSYECEYAHKVSLKTKYDKKCRECGKHFTTTRSKGKYCSNECGSKFSGRKKEALRRKRISSNGDVHWDISIERLMKRDKAVCYLCNELVLTNLDTNHDYYPSIEHVKPIARGGTHTWDNVKLAHRKCNYEKGTVLL